MPDRPPIERPAARRAKAAATAIAALLAVAAAALGWLRREPPDLRPTGASPKGSSAGVAPLPEPVATRFESERLRPAPPAELGTAATVPSTDRFLFTVTVLDERLTPLSDANVLLAESLEAPERDPPNAATREAAPLRLSRRSGADGCARLEPPLEDVARLRWLIVQRDGFATAVEWLGEVLDSGRASAGHAEFTLTLARPRHLALQVIDVLNRPIVGASAKATAAWGDEARARADTSVAARLAPTATSDADGRFELDLAPELEFDLEVSQEGFLPYARSVRPHESTDAAQPIVLQRICAAGVRVVGVPARDVAFLASVSDDEDALWRDRRWSLAIGAAQQQLVQRLAARDVHWRFLPEGSNGALPQREPITAILPGSGRRERDIELRFRPVAEFGAADLVVVDGSGAAGTASLRVRFKRAADDDRPLDRAWCLQRPGTWRRIQTELAADAPDELLFDQLEAGEWTLAPSHPQFARFPGERPSVMLRDGEQRVLEFTPPELPATRLRLDVTDAFGRPVESFDAMLQSPFGVHAVRDEPLFLDPGSYRVTVSARGYPDAVVDVELSGPEVRCSVVLAAPADATSRLRPSSD